MSRTVESRGREARPTDTNVTSLRPPWWSLRAWARGLAAVAARAARAAPSPRWSRQAYWATQADTEANAGTHISLPLTLSAVSCPVCSSLPAAPSMPSLACVGAGAVGFGCCWQWSLASIIAERPEASAGIDTHRHSVPRTPSPAHARAKALRAVALRLA